MAQLERENERLKQKIEPGQLTVHADRGSSMRLKTVTHLLASLGVTKTHSRRHVSNDNPYSEAQFKTLKYCPAFSERFGSIQAARAFGQPFFDWYNKEYRHSGIALMTPQQVHYGLTKKVFNFRSQVLTEAFRNKPNRFKGKIPKPLTLPEAVWINKPSTNQKVTTLATQRLYSLFIDLYPIHKTTMWPDSARLGGRFGSEWVAG